MTAAAPLKNRTAIVTGASSGIGRAIAETLGGAGAYVFLAGRTVASMDASRKQIEECGGRAGHARLRSRGPHRQHLLDRGPATGIGVYGATKHAVNTISATLRSELEEDSIRVVNVMPGAIATNFARNFEPAFVEGFVKMAGLDIEVKKGERLPDEVFEKLQGPLEKLLGVPQDVADAVLFAVTQPIRVNIADISVRPAKQIDLG